MKTKTSFTIFMIALIAIFLLAAFPITAQSATTGAEVVQQVDQTATTDLTNLFTSLTGLAAGVLFFTSLVKKYIKTNGVATIIMSGVVSFLLGGVGLFLQLGIFAAVEWYYIFIYGLAATAMANGLSTWGFISDFLILLKLKLPTAQKITDESGDD